MSEERWGVWPPPDSASIRSQARREALEEAAKVAWDVITDASAATYPEELAGHVGDAIRSLKETP